MTGIHTPTVKASYPDHWTWLQRVRWWLFGMPKFKPCVLYSEELMMTTILLEDTGTVWCPWGDTSVHSVDVGYGFDGRIVGVQIWDDVRERKSR